jgi:hypothetical protein
MHERATDEVRSARLLHMVRARLLWLFFALVLPAALGACPSDPPGGGSDVDSGPGDEGEGEGEGEDETPPTDPIRTPDPTNPDNANLDSDCDGLTDLEEFADAYAGGGQTNPGDYDSDDDGVADGVEAGRTASIDAQCPATWLDADASSRTSPIAADSDGDCISDGAEDRNNNGRVDAGETDPNNGDSDGDGLGDGEEDADCDGTTDANETSAVATDSDGDGVNDGVEVADGLDPLRDDSDGDGVPDGADVNPSVADPDEDDDGLPDSIDLAPENPDRDGDGLLDGAEDANRNGLVDAGETDPERADTDGDGLDDDVERDRGTNPRIADSDGDLLEDGVEVNLTLTNPRDRDSDDDGLSDGLEDRNGDGQVAPPNPAGQETDPRVADTDGDGITDGLEDRNRNGRVDLGETDPRQTDTDSDGDGLSDAQEAALGTNANRADTDSDGVDDGAEVGSQGTDPLDTDSDDDGLNDGVEVRAGTNPLRTDTDLDGIPDGVEDRDRDGVRDANETNPRSADSDGDGVIDGAEDGNQNGLVDSGELNPLDPSDVQNRPAVSQACADPVTPELVARAEADVLLALAPFVESDGGFRPEDVRPILRAGQVVGSSAFDRQKGIVAFAIRTTPAATAQATLSTVESRLGEQLSLPITQTFTTWDGFEAARGTYNLASAVATSTRMIEVARIAIGLDAADATLSLDFSDLPVAVDDFGSLKLGLVVVRRSPTTAVMVGVATNLALFTDRSTGRDFRLEDVAGGTALGQVGDAVGTQCDVKTAAADVPVDFLWILDNSGSMGDELNAVSRAVASFSSAIANTDLDSRVAVATTEFQYRTGGPFFSDDNDVAAECTFNGSTLSNEGTRICACAYTSPTESELFQDCVARIRDIDLDDQQILGGSGAEGGYLAAQEFLRDVLTQPTSPARRRLRAQARVVTLFITDAGDQSSATDTARVPYLPSAAFVTNQPCNTFPDPNSCVRLSPDEPTALRTSVNFWADIFGNRAGDGWDPTRTNEPPMLLAGILCPLATQPTVRLDINDVPFETNGCNGEEDNTGTEPPGFVSFQVGAQRFGIQRYYGVINELGGIAGSIADTFGDGFQGPDLQNISATIDAILRSVVTASSPYQLTRAPIAATIKVALAEPTVGNCNVDDVPRVTDLNANGFLYDATTNRIAFVGACRPAATGTDVAASYRTWIDLTANPDGAPLPCGGDCPAPLVCVEDECVCPGDCGVPGGLGTGQTCDTTTDGNGDGNPDCIVECLPDCGGCAPGNVCDTSSCTCGCPADCNFGGTLPVGFVCNPTTCQAECAPDRCVGDDPGGNFVCGPACVYECPDDCGGGLGENERCNPTTCEPECSPDCNANCDGFTTCNPESCACECRENASCAPGYAFDPLSCTCVCSAAELACAPTRDADLENCRCTCDAQCNGACAPGLACLPSTCACVTIDG